MAAMQGRSSGYPGSAWSPLADGTTETEVLEQLWASTAAALRESQAGTRECWVLALGTLVRELHAAA
ncbi:MAG: hypothetical protein IPK52_18325 [Chloroflexi bacterium]|nr:hypothetical protein [Chloroflexota bacterium]